MSKTQKKGPAFLLKTFDMLQKEQFKQIIDWIPDGNGFVVKNSEELSQKVLPKYFKHSNMHSFIRQLNMYGFHKKRASKIENYYFHHQFSKGQRQLISQMHRKAQKKGGHKQLQKEEERQEQLSIQIEQSQQNKQNKNQQNRRNSNEMEENNVRKKIAQIISANKVLLLEQIYHLANVDSTNLLRYIENVDDATGPNMKKTQNNSNVQRYIKAKERYLKIQCLMWDKTNAIVQTFEAQCSKKSSKSLKQTQLEISKQNLEKTQIFPGISKSENVNQFDFEYENQKIQEENVSSKSVSISVEQKEMDSPL